MSTAKLGVLSLRDPISSQRNTSIYMDNSGYIRIDRPDGNYPVISGKIMFDHSIHPIQTPIIFTHSNVFANTDPYLSGTIKIAASGINNNQPILEIETFKNDSSFGNGPSIILVNKYATSGTDTTSVDVEIIANNSFVNAYNGKWELNALCGRTSGTADTLDGYFSIAYRVGPEDSGGANSRFRRMFNFYPNTAVGKGKVESRGCGILINPEFSHSTDAYFEISNNFGNARATIKSTLAGSDAYIDIVSGSPGVATTGGNYRIYAGQDDRLSIRNMSAGNIKLMEFLRADSSNRGIMAIYSYNDTTSAELRFGDATNGQIIKASNKIFNFATVGNSTKITTDTNYYVRSTQIVKASIVLSASTVTTTVTNAATECTLWVNVTTNGSAQYNIIVPTTPNNGFMLRIIANDNIGNLLISSADPNTTTPVSFTESITGLTAGISRTLMYYAPDNTWIIIK